MMQGCLDGCESQAWGYDYCWGTYEWTKIVVEREVFTG